jgi:ABC-type lipoprotein export system ATPase subunit
LNWLQNRVGIMIVHDLRLCQYVDRMIQIQGSKAVHMSDNRNDYGL